MVVQHNLRAMNSNRMLGLTAGIQSKSTEKLSSGYKINRAADDAAGLSISEKMRKQIRGLTQASLNAADGISTVQTAEGALNEVQDMLQRMNELAVKAANGTMSEDDRSYIQNEIDQLITEIDRVSETTKFNETYLLKGGSDAPTTNVYNYAEAAEAAEPQLVWGEGMQTESGKFSVEYLNEASTTLSFKGNDKVISVDIAYTDEITESKEIELQSPTANTVADATITGLVAVSSTAGSAAGTSVWGFDSYNSTTDYYDVNGNKLGNGSGGTVDVSTLVNVDSDSGTVTLKPGVEIYSDSIAVPEKLYVTGNGVSDTINANNYSKYVEIDNNSVKVKDGYTLFNTSAVTSADGEQITAAMVSDSDTLNAFFSIKDDILYNSNSTGVTETNLSAYIDPTTGKYKQGTAALYKDSGCTIEIGADALSKYVKVETNKALWATKNGETEEVTADNINDYFELDTTGALAIKAGVQIYNTSDNQEKALGVTAQEIIDRIGKKTNALYDNGGNVVAESKLSAYFDAATGKYKGTETGAQQPSDYLYLDGGQKLGAEEVINYLNVTPAGAQDINIYAVDNAGKATRVNEGNMDQFFNVGKDGEVTVKEGFQLYTSPTDTTSANKLADSDISNYVTGSITAVTDKDGNKVVAEELKNYFNEDGSYKGGLYKNGQDEISATEVSTFVSTTTETEVPEALTLSLHVGADGTANNKITVDIKAMSAKSLGVSNVRVDGADDTNATASIDVIAKAIQEVSKQRSQLGAVQNRLEHTIANLDNVVENTTAAESQIRDTDMATEMVKFSNNNILAQAGQAMLAQANQANQGVLSLLG